MTINNFPVTIGKVASGAALAVFDPALKLSMIIANRDIVPGADIIPTNLLLQDSSTPYLVGNARQIVSLVPPVVNVTPFTVRLDASLKLMQIQTYTTFRNLTSAAVLNPANGDIVLGGSAQASPPAGGSLLGPGGGFDLVTMTLSTPQAAVIGIDESWRAEVAGANPKRGQTFTYAIKVFNSGGGAANGVVVQDTPDGRPELALTASPIFSVGTLAAGASQTLTLPASAGAAGTYTNSATVTWSDSTGKSGTATATTTTTIDPQPGDFAVMATGPVPLKTGVRQVLADGSTVYVVNNPGDTLTLLNCAGGACNTTAAVRLGTGPDRWRSRKPAPTFWCSTSRPAR